MGTQEEQMSKRAEGPGWKVEYKTRQIHYDFIMLSDSFVRTMCKNGTLKEVVDKPSKVITLTGGYLGPCEGCILAVNCSEMCEEKEMIIISDVNSRVEMI